MTRRVVTFLLCGFLAGCSTPMPAEVPVAEPQQSVVLPAPSFEGAFSLEEALHARRSVREYCDGPLRLEEVSQLLWAAQGITSEWGGRTAPSAGALYPLEVYLVVLRVLGLEPGVYRYAPRDHGLLCVRRGNVERELIDASAGQQFISRAAAVLVINAMYERTTTKYGERGIHYVHMEAGHAAQNVCLQATVLDLGCVTVGAFDDEAVHSMLGSPAGESPLYLLPVGPLTPAS